jgi:CIC family chloride channel protein
MAIITATANPQDAKSRRIGLVSLCALTFGLGIVTGLGAVLFRGLIGCIHNLMFLGPSLCLPLPRRSPR